MSNVIHKFPDILDDNMNKRLYLLQSQELTKDQYDMIKATLGPIFPGRQVVVEGSKYYLLSEEDTEAALTRTKAELTAKGKTFPVAASTVTPESSPNN